VSISNTSGEISVSAGAGDEVVVEAVKRATDRSQLANVQVKIEEFSGGRIDIRTDYSLGARNVRVDYTVTVPVWAALELHSVSGPVRATGVQGTVRAESVSGPLRLNDLPKLQTAKAVSGPIELSGIGGDDVTASTVSGAVTAKGIKTAGLALNTISGRIELTNAAAERLSARSISGPVEYSGTLTKGGRYEINSHSGGVHLTLTNTVGFELTASSFSGSIRTELPVTVASDTPRQRARNESVHGTFGDGSAALTIRTFSGNIQISK
jgi:DUF4097 and DUF4098 domain-containing protein YvlB